MEGTSRCRGRSFHEDYDTSDDANDIESSVTNIDSGKNINKDDDNEEDEEEQMYSRGRSRSRSIIETENSHISQMPVNVVESILTPSADNSNSEIKQFEKVERTGPLHQREVLALRKGLIEATPTRNKEQLLEEELEKRDAETERMLRMKPVPGMTSSLSSSEQITKKYKILLLGDSGVGKSSLLLRWTMDTFNPTLVGTIGINFKTKKVIINEHHIQVQVWDTAGQEQFHKITTSYYRGANAIILIYDVCDEKTFSNVEYWIKNIKQHASESVHVTLVGNKTDLRAMSPNSIEAKRGMEVASRFNVPYFETSAKDTSNVEETFMSSVRGILAAEIKSLPSSKNDENAKILLEKSKKTKFVDIFKDKKKQLSVDKSAENNVLHPDSFDEKDKCTLS